MYCSEEFVFPEILDPTTHYYPPALFDEREIKLDEVTIFERLDDAEITVIIAKFAVLEVLKLGREGTWVKIARNEGSRESFIADIRKMQHSAHKGYEGMTKGDVELIAEELEVYEIIWPLDEKQMAKEAEHVRKQFQELASH